MDVVVDANVLFAGLIKDGASRRLLVSDSLRMHAPEFILEEIEKYNELILRKTGKSKEEFQQVLSMLRRRMTLVPLSELIPFLNEAEQVSPDEKDIAYLALALKLSLPLWSNDSSLKEKQKAVKIYSTDEMIQIITD